MARLFRTLAASLGLLGVLAAIGFVTLGPKRVWRIAGEADQGSVDWDRLQRSANPNDAFAASLGASATPADITLDPFDGEPSELVRKVDAYLRSNALPETFERVDDGRDPLYRRYVARTPMMGFPDTLNVAARRVGDRTGLLLYSRSLVGKSDLGANRKRILSIVDAVRSRPIASQR
ncbi:DUF1499 domain-containing protein [Fulvimarina endophytica]|nr:DUF1499 domain-containing protein [Fulvimarina endophytica]